VDTGTDEKLITPTTTRGSTPGWHAFIAGPPGLIPTVLCAGGSILLVLSALIHLHLWSTGYKHIATIGPLFLVQIVAGFAMAVVVTVARRAVTALAGALFAIGTVGGLVISVEVGLFGFKDSFSAPYATTSLAVELAAVVVLGVATFFCLHAATHAQP